MPMYRARTSRFFVRNVLILVIVAANIILMPFSYLAVRQTNSPLEIQEKIKIDEGLKYTDIHVDKTYTILSYSKDPWITELNQNLMMKTCEYNNCEVVEDSYFFGSSHAVIFHGVNLMKEPPLKSPKQIWIFMALESPMHHSSDFMLPSWNDLFNWTMTYRSDSDIYFPYSEIRMSAKVKRRNFTNILQNKKKLAVIAISHCDTPSKREEYVRVLQSYIQVDVFGKCGPWDCGPWEQQQDCYQRLDREYRFYLSFENSICTDYITEKAFFPYYTDLIPIVRGGISYSKKFPHGTYIHTSNFQTIRQLADFVLKLNSSDEHMIRYLERKNQYKIMDKHKTYQRAMCDICKKLNTGENENRVYHRVDDWLWGSNSCFYPRDIIP